MARRNAGFTLIELMVVMVIIAMLVAIAAPRYFNHIGRAKEAALKQSLNVMRDAIDKFHGDLGRYPASLEDIVERRYLRNVPVDPFTDNAATWVTTPPPDTTADTVYDVHSGAPGLGSDGRPYTEW